MKKNNHNLKIIIFGIFVIIVLFFIDIYIMQNIFSKSQIYASYIDEKITKNVENQVNTSFKEDQIIIEIEPEPVKTYKAKLIGGGDALLHSPIYKVAYNSKEGSYDFSYMLSLIKDEIAEYDIKYYNQEVIFDDDKTYSSYPLFNAPSAWGNNMINDLGFNLISLATNHSMDCGNNSAKKSARWWEIQENILATGMASSEEKRNEYKIKEINGITYTMLSYTYGTNGIPVTEDYVVNIFDKEKVLKDINEVRDKVDILIVAMHWGEEYNTGITDTQKEQAKFLGENGVDIILGNHSHCIEPWEWIDEDTVVFYSFGNLISSQMTAQTPIIRKVGPVGLLGSLEITKTVDTEKNERTITIGNIGAEIIYTYRYYNNEKGQYDYLIVPFSKMKSEYLSNYKEVYEEFSSVLTRFDENISIAPLPEEIE